MSNNEGQKPNLMQIANNYLNQLKLIISNMKGHRQEIFVKWLKRHNNFLAYETKYDPHKDRTLKRGNVVYVDFGFRVGKEYGGFHWAVVVNSGDNKSAHTVVVVPLSSVKTGQTVHPKDADLGIIEGLNGNRAEALLGQITTISKMRIQKEKGFFQLNKEQMDTIDHKILERYINPSLKKKLLD